MAHFSELKDGSNLNDVKFPRARGNDGFFENPDSYVEFGVVEGCGGDNPRLRPIFDEVLSIFTREVSVNKDVFRPFPPRLGNGREADLFKLFWVVRRIGGYEQVSESELWEIVAEECGLEAGLVASLKLIYVKYLKELDQWLSQGGFRDKKKENNSIRLLEKLDLLSQELEGYKGPSSSGEEKAEVDDKVELDEKRKFVGIELGDNEGVLDENDDEATLHKVVVENGSCMDTDAIVGKIEVECLGIIDDDKKFSVKHEKGLVSSPKDVVNEVLRFHSDNSVPLSDKDVDLSKIEAEPSSTNVDERFSDKDGNRIMLSPKNAVKDFGSAADDDENKAASPEVNDSVISAKTVVEKSFSSDKRKREDDKQVICLNGNDAEKVGSSQKRMRVDESAALSEMLNWVANAARNPQDIAIGTLPQSSKWDKYGREEIWKRALLAREALFAKNVNAEKEQLGLQRKKQRVSPAMYIDNKSPSPRGSQRITSVKFCSCPGCISHSSGRGKHHKAEAPRTAVQELPDSSELHDCVPEKSEKVAVIREGPGYQADVPEWTGVVSESDPKWLGTPMWPPPEDGKRHDMDLMVVGKGRESSCDCRYPGSAECIRFHVAENRMKLSQALGPLFRRWGFNQMGEEVALSWTLEEEQEFKNLVVKAKQDLTQVTSVQEITRRFWRRASVSLPTKTKAQLVNYYFNVFILRRRCYQNRVTPTEIDSDDDEKEMGLVGVSLGYEKINGVTMKCLENKQCTHLDD